MGKYVKLPIEIEAIQFVPKNNLDMYNFLSNAPRVKLDFTLAGKEEIPYITEISIETLEGTMKASIGDYIIKGVNGEFYPCKKEIFEKTYRKVGD